MTQRMTILRFAHWRRIVVCLLCAFAALAFFPRPALAHPMGNFTTNRYSRLDVGSDGVELLFIVDMAEIPTHSERILMDTDGDKVVSPLEAEIYVAEIAASLPPLLPLMLNGGKATWLPVEHEIRFVPGQADLPTLRMEFVFHAALPTGEISVAGMKREMQDLAYMDASYPGRMGWKEIIVVPAAGVELLDSNVAQRDLSNQLQNYPVDLLQNPLVVDSANISWRFSPILSDQNDQQTKPSETGSASSLGEIGGFTDLVSIELGPWAVILALLAAFGWGAVHALSPGHGKTIVAAYLVGARGTFAHALFLGATTTITHTLGVFVLGLATLVASQYILPERIYPWLSTLSGLLVISIGLSIGWNRLRSLLRGEAHDHPQHLDHEDHHHEDHHHDEHHHSHSHAGHTHSHMPPGADGSAVTWRGLLALGISGGLLPCPSALVVMLGSIALGRAGFGLVLILAFSLGLATVLTAFGLLLLRAGKLFVRIPESGRYARYLAVASAAFITLVGAGITVQALVETGILSRFA